MKGGGVLSAGGGGSVGPLGGAAVGGGCAAPAFAAGAVPGALGAAGVAGLAAAAGGLDAAGAAGFGAPCAGGVGCPVTELVSLVVDVWAAVGFSGFGAGGSSRAGGAAAADAPAPGESLRDTSPLSGSPGVVPAGLSATAVGGGSRSFGSSGIHQAYRLWALGSGLSALCNHPAHSNQTISNQQ
jgi:hypothetical protein